MRAEPRTVRLLASVTDPVEAELAVALGADLVDAKNPAQGALGALSYDVVSRIVAAVGGRRPVSATIGDMPCEPDAVARAAQAMAAAGVDFVKIGLFPEGDVEATLARLGALRLGPCRLVGVMLADRHFDMGLLPSMARAGFAGAMLDTADKASGSLLEVLAMPRLADFVSAARREGLLAGLAGALRRQHIPMLLGSSPLTPDILGFRGALCDGTVRTGAIDPQAMRAIRSAIPAKAEHRNVREALAS